MLFILCFLVQHAGMGVRLHTLWYTTYLRSAGIPHSSPPTILVAWRKWVEPWLWNPTNRLKTLATILWICMTASHPTSTLTPSSSTVGCSHLFSLLHWCVCWLSALPCPCRAYMSVKELKEALQLNSTHFLNVYFASSVREELAGAATWPWDKEALSHLGKQAAWLMGSQGFSTSVSVGCLKRCTRICSQVELGEKTSLYFETKTFVFTYTMLNEIPGLILQLSPSLAWVGISALSNSVQVACDILVKRWWVELQALERGQESPQSCWFRKGWSNNGVGWILSDHPDPIHQDAWNGQLHQWET